MSDEQAANEFERYKSALRKVQSGIAHSMSLNGDSSSEHKHLRVGIDSAHISDAALVKLLVRKGVITDLEYATELADEAEREVARNETKLSERLGTNVTLGEAGFGREE